METNTVGWRQPGGGPIECRNVDGPQGGDLEHSSSGGWRSGAREKHETQSVAGRSPGGQSTGSKGCHTPGNWICSG